MKHDITKECADSLRSFAKHHFGVQLKSSHAHELFAAYMGYSSRAALLADKKCPITNLSQAEFIVLQPTAPIKERCKELNGLPEELVVGLTEGAYSPILVEKRFFNKIWPTFESLAMNLAVDITNSRGMFFNDQKIQREGVKVETYEEGVYLMVLHEYVSPSRVLSDQPGIRGVVDLIKLKRVAGYVGYVKAGHHWAEGETLEAAIEKIENSGGESLDDQKPDGVDVETLPKFELGFADWLAKHKNRDSLLGDLAIKRGFTVKGDGWPSYNNLEAYKDHLNIGSQPRGTTATLERAWKTYESFLKKKCSTGPKKQAARPATKKSESRPIVFVKNLKPLHYTKRTIENFMAGDKAWISWDGKKAIPVTVTEVDERYYTFTVERPLKNAGNEHYVRLDEVRSTPELACLNCITS
ncbi:hypothetical protein OQX61_02220 [Pedobacter sp. PLR]|uniref:hypothetical protein n=1 Tax=Pedobacter sp. PLR TaxID=2994465 RepID=UPI0022459CAA|nr:hypothetical protein [Pedobacter sp. PLR]MCX2450075.1 hypothetical protein [Pedobacter sp. PLR]